MDAAAALEMFDVLEAEAAPVPNFRSDSDGNRSLSDLKDMSSSEEDKWDNAFLGSDSDSGGDENNSDSWSDSDGGDDGDGFNYDPPRQGAGRRRAAVRGRGHAAGRRQGIGGQGNTVGGRGGRGLGARGDGAGPRCGHAHRGRGGAHFFLGWTYNDADVDGPAQIPPFQPNNDHEGLNLPAEFAPTNELDFFRLYFSDEIVDDIVQFTNAHAHANIPSRPLYSRHSDGHWQDTTREEIYKVIALLIHQSLSKLPEACDYWSTASLFNGNYKRNMIPSY